MKPTKPWTPTRDTQYPGKGYRVSQVRVRVGLAYPRVTHSTLPSPSHSCRNDRIPQESAGIHQNETGFLRIPVIPAGMEPESTGIEY